VVKVVDDLIHAYVHDDVEGMSACLHESVEYTEKPSGLVIQYRDPMIEHWMKWKNALPDLRGKLLHVFKSGDHIAVETRWSGHMQPEFLKHIDEADEDHDEEEYCEFDFAWIIELEGGLIRRIRSYFCLEKTKE
jgi:ketosteroid isomerase-like protein